MAQRLLLSRVLVRPFDVAKESQLPDSFDRMIQLFRETQGDERAFVDMLTENDLERRFDMPILRSSPTVADGLIHIVMHSQNHRGQCLVRLRENGVKPPTLDYILWARDRPARLAELCDASESHRIGFRSSLLQQSSGILETQ